MNSSPFFMEAIKKGLSRSDSVRKSRLKPEAISQVMHRDVFLLAQKMASATATLKIQVDDRDKHICELTGLLSLAHSPVRCQRDFTTTNHESLFQSELVQQVQIEQIERAIKRMLKLVDTITGFPFTDLGDKLEDENGQIQAVELQGSEKGEDKRKSTCKYDINKHAFRVSGLRIIELFLQNQGTKLAMLQRNLELSAKQNDCHQVQCQFCTSLPCFISSLFFISHALSSLSLF